MSALANQLLGRIEHDLLTVQQEITDLKMTTIDASTRQMLMKALVAVKHLRDELENLVLDSLDDEDLS